MRSSVNVSGWSKLFGGLFLGILGLHLVFDTSLQTAFDAVLRASDSAVLTALLAVSALTADVLLPIPSSVIAIAVVLALGFIGGFLSIWAGLCLSCLFGYWIGRVSRGWLLSSLFKPSDLQQARSLGKRWGAPALVVLRAVPVLAEASVVAAGISQMPLKKFLGVTALANAGIALVYAAIAAYAQAEASFFLAFAASLALPLCAMGLFNLYKRKSAQAGVEDAQAGVGEETLTPTFDIRFSFPLSFTNGAFRLENNGLARLIVDKYGKPGKALFFVDEGVVNARPQLQAEIAAYCEHHGIEYFQRMHVLPGADAAKTQQQIELMYQQMLDVALDRQSYVVAIGGGAVLDAVGFAAATFHRGIRLLRMPTTVLAQNDAGVGVKNGINAVGIKNLYGSFAVPYAIVNDSEFLQTLSRRDFRSGFAEAIKVGLIRDAAFFHWICSSVDKLNAREAVATRHLIKRCAELHLRQICTGGDPFEMGSARPLDYGHWSAHKLESLTKHELAHGEAVAIGMALDALYAVETNMLALADAEKIIELISELGFNVWHPALACENDAGESLLLRGLEEFRQHLGGELCITLLTGIGETVEVNHIDSAALLRARDKLKRYENPGSANQPSQLLQQHSSR